MAKVELACKFAQEMHKGQKYGAEDYFEKHVQGVVDSVYDSISKTTKYSSYTMMLLTVVAYLHDTVEDTPATTEEIEEVFGQEVAEAVDALTHREGEDYQSYVKRAIANDLARVVKYHDIMFNLNQTLTSSTGDNLNKRRCKKYMKALSQFGNVL